MKRCWMQWLMMAALVIGALPVTADEFYVNGECDFIGTDDRGIYHYEMVLEWNTDKNGLSHLNVLLDDSGNCSLEQLISGITLPDPLGEGVGEPTMCKVVFEGAIEAQDPSVDLFSLVMKFEPVANPLCEPGSTGWARFRIESPYGPAPIAADNLFVFEKSGNDWSRGQLHGLFPGLPCNPVDSEVVSWGQVKASYR